ncbi:hypothetical protein QFC20_004690 [Naganishia adeliensis]|uniref:Uncharacterized protein n=1 Tax=Naganishia adeliensis TaxID=92952 RepID=A0ACC2VWI8_9TREE|nr:hypothetical protein QFC20_004690 [Naganishia adeliensis]
MTLPAIQHRRVTESDRDTLLSMRKSCGWGSNRIDSYLSEPTMATYLFYCSSEDGQEQPVGMGCLVFDLPGDPAMASREKGTIAIASLFVYPESRASGVGNQVFTILERLAIEDYGAKTLAVDTRAYEIPWASEGETSYLKKWYERRGYVEFRPAERRYDQNGPPDCADSPDKSVLLYACFLRKEVA